MLLKPDMDHLETWPNVFIKNQTYVSFSWDAEDLIAAADLYLNNKKEREQIARNAFDFYRSQLAELPRRFEQIITEIEGR
jgi:hypothetical protein